MSQASHTETSRRQFLALGTAAIASASIPALAPVPAPAAVAKAPMLSWSIGQDDSWNWKPIKARTEHEARVNWMGLTDGTNGECEEGGPFNPECDCEECSTYHSLDVERRPEWDGHRVECGDQHWHKSGLGSICTRCSDEAYADSGSKWVSGKVVCETCLTVEDWDVLDPDIAAEMRSDMEDSGLPASPTLNGRG